MSVLARYSVTAVLARLADEGARVALVLLAIQRTGSAAFGGLLVAALMVPHVVAAPLVGTAADRVNRRRLFYSAVLLGYGCALIAATILVSTVRGAPARSVAVALIVLAGCGAPLLVGGLTSLLRELVPERLDTAFSLDSSSYSTAGIVGPAIAAVLASAVGATITMIILGASVAASCLVLLTLPISDQRSATRPVPDWRDAFGGVPLLWRRRSLGAVTVGSSLGQLGIGAMPVVAVLLATRFHHTSYTGVFMSALSVGALVGSLLYARFPVRRYRPEWVLLAALLISAVPFALTPLMPTMLAMLPLFILVGLINGPLFCSLLAVREREAPPHLHTQVFTLGAGLRSTAAAAGAAAAGLCAGWGPGTLLLGIAACYGLGAMSGVAVLKVPCRDAAPAHLASATTAIRDAATARGGDQS
jgi:MFS family permease